MNPGLLDISGTYAAPLAPTAETPRRGSSGAAALAFAPAAPIWLGRAQARPTTADIGGGQRVTADTTFLARWSASLCEGGRIVADGRSFDILTIVDAPNSARRSWVHIACRHVKGVNSAPRPATAFAT